MNDSNDALDKYVSERETENKNEGSGREKDEREEGEDEGEAEKKMGEEEDKGAEEENGKKEGKGAEEEKGADEEEDFAVIPPNGGWGWMVVFCAFYCNVVTDGIQLTFGIFLKAISTEFHTEYSKVALAGSLMFGVHLLMGPVCSGCNSVFGLRPVTIAGCLICCFGVGISYFANGYWYLYFTFGIIGGVGLGLVYMNTLVITSLYFTTLMPIAIAIVVCGTGIGTMIFAGLSSFLLRVTTWRISLLIQAALSGTMALAALSFRPLKPVKVKVKIMGKKPPSPPERPPSEHEASSSRRRSVFIKTDERSSFIDGYQNLALSFAEIGVERELPRKNCPECSTCCRKRKPVHEEKSILVLAEIPTGDRQSRRKSYVEKFVNEAEEEEEIAVTERQHSLVSHRSVYTRIEIKEEKPRNRFCETLKKTLVVMLDYRLLTSCSFFTFTVSGAISLAAFLIVFVYEEDRGETLGFSEETSVYFVVSLGAVNVFWRLILGAIAILPKIRYWALTISGMIIGGIATMISGYSPNIYFQFTYCFIFGLAMASFAVFRMPLLIDLVGMDFLENAAGINLLFMGVFCIAFPPIFGCIKEATNSYNLIFMINGSLIVISALMLIRLKKVDINKIKGKNTIANSGHKFRNKN